MAGTRFVVAWTFCLKLGALIALGLYWGFFVDDDDGSWLHHLADVNIKTKINDNNPLLLRQWWRLWWETQQEETSTPRQLWDTLSLYKKSNPTSQSSFLPGLTVGWSFSDDDPLEMWLLESQSTANLKIQRWNPGSKEDVDYMQHEETLYCTDDDDSAVTALTSKPPSSQDNLPDLWICSPRTENQNDNQQNHKTKRAAVRLGPGGRLFWMNVGGVSSSQQQSTASLVESLNLLLAPTTGESPLPVETCWMLDDDDSNNNLVQFHFLLAPLQQQDSAVYFDAWAAWAKALEQARLEHSMSSWFPILENKNGNTASLPRLTQQVTLLTGDSALSPKQQHHSTTTTSNQTRTTRKTSSYITLEQVQAYFDEQQQEQRNSPSSSSSNGISVHLFIPNADDNRIVLLADNEEPQLYDTHDNGDTSVEQLQIAANNNSLFIILPPAPKVKLADGDGGVGQTDVAARILQQTSQCITRRCLGLSERIYTDLEWKHIEREQSLSSQRNSNELPTWFSKLFWQRALSYANSHATRRAETLVKRYKVWDQQEHEKKQQTDDLESLEDLLQSLFSMDGLLHPQPTGHVATTAVQRIATAHKWAMEQGRYAAAVRLLLQQESGGRGEQGTTFDDKNDDNNATSMREDWNVLLLLDMTWDQYAAILAPLLIPLMLPSVITVIRETRRYAKLRFGKK